MNNSPPLSQRVVVTGIGAISPIGIGKKNYWENLLAGTNGTGPVPELEEFNTGISVAGIIPEFIPADFIPPDQVSSCGRTSQLAIAAAQMALEDAGYKKGKDLAGEEVSIFMGTTMGEANVQEEMVYTWLREDITKIQLDHISKVPDCSVAQNIGRILGIEGNCLVFPTACSAGNYAIGYGYDLLQSGQASIVLAGGCDSFSKIAFIGFGRMLALAPEKCQPFDKNRRGIIVSEGSGIIILESLQHALERRADIYAEVLGYGLSCDAYHMTTTQIEGVQPVMERALIDAEIQPQDVDLICAHGTGTRINDKVESQAVNQIFAQKRAIPVVSIKSMLGHTMGAASALEAIACIMAIREGKVPPTINFETPDEECPVDCVPNRMRSLDIRIALNNSFAFGSNNAATVFSRFEP